MKHRNRLGELQFHLSQEAEMPSYKSVCICFVDIYIPTYFQINLTYIWFIFPLQISLTVLQNLNDTMKYRKLRGELQFHLSRQAEKPSYMSVCICYDNV